MLLIREHFIAKPGCAGKLAKMMKEVMEVAGATSRIMTDAMGDFNQVVIETETPSLAEFEAWMMKNMTNPAIREKMTGYNDLWITGKREVFRLV
ncbi:MAG: hypothetical protein ABL967_19865 [Bryobacteraceae bacterium]